MKHINMGLMAAALALLLSLQTGRTQGTPGAIPDTSAGTSLSGPAADVVKLAQSGVGDDVVLPYVQNSQAPFNLSADNIVYLRDLGVSSAVVAAMINHDQGQAGQPAQAVVSQPVSTPTVGSTATYSVTATGNAPLTYQWSFNGTDYSTDAPEDVNYYYNDLAPYGTWVDLDGYGWCWQPTALAMNPHWQPYCDAGHWVYTDGGWFWQSDYSWGWAPFHYGRWFHHERNGWVWFPDRVWGPAWVTWRTAGNNCGWAPLPLHTVFEENGGGFMFNGVRVGANFDFGLPANCFTFVALGDFCAPDVVHHCLPPAEVTRIYSRTTIVNNYTIVNKTIVNHGIPVERVASATHTTIRPVVIHDAPPGAGRRPEEAGVVYRRAPKAPEAVVPVRAQKVDERHPLVQHPAPPPVNVEHHVESGTPPVRTVETPPAKTIERPVKTPVQNERPVKASGPPVEIVGPAPEGPAPKPVGSGKVEAHVPRSQHVADQAHALPPLIQPHDAPVPQPPNKPPVYTPRSQHVAEQAHTLPPLKSAPPPPVLSQPTTQPTDKVTSPRNNSQPKH